MKILKNFRLEKGVVKLLESAAKKTNKSMTQLVEEAVRAKLSIKQ